MWDSIHPSTNWVESHIPAVGLGSLRQVSRYRGLNVIHLRSSLYKEHIPMFLSRIYVRMQELEQKLKGIN